MFRFTRTSFSQSVNTKKRSLYAWGTNDDGQLGLNHYNFQAEPQKVEDISPSIKTFSLGLNHAAVITEDGASWTWGSNQHMQTGKEGGMFDIFDDSEQQNFPSKVERLEGFKIRTVKCGWFHTMFLTESGTLCGMGNGTLGQLGFGSLMNISAPANIVLRGQVPEKIACGAAHTLVLTDEGVPLAFGKDFAEIPKKIQQFGDEKFEKIACGAFHSVFARGDEVVTMGDGSVDEKPWDPYQFKKNTELKIRRQKIPGKVSEISAGVNETLALTEEGKLFWWKVGENPTAVTALDTFKLKKMAISPTHFGVITDEGRLFSWEVKGGKFMENSTKFQEILKGHKVDSVDFGWDFGMATCEN
eukprot:TRINITY_DN10876_c0_g1_i2.p1 TRINITY_DN10876_c0_g1~~TRINITY_DN10876_c0_g1_i2.p1  ORF type:complete len:358 (-),score=78.16 TRINITY_DN10876_c0_g1_i2:24-1097(-)